MSGNFLDIARAHWTRYPAMEPQDFAKLAYQSEFGPAHMVRSPDKALAALLAERKEAGTEHLPPEPIGNGLCRFHLTQALSTLSELPLIGRMFTLTMGSVEGTVSGLWRAGGGRAVPPFITARRFGAPTAPTTGFCKRSWPGSSRRWSPSTGCPESITPPGCACPARGTSGRMNVPALTCAATASVPFSSLWTAAAAAEKPAFPASWSS